MGALVQHRSPSLRHRYASPCRARSRLGTRPPLPGTITTSNHRHQINQPPQNPGLDTLSGATPGGGDHYVTVVIDPTPVRDRSGPARPLDVASGRSKKALKAWIAARGESWRKRFEVVAMDGFTGFRNTVGEESPEAQRIMDPYHVVSLAAGKVDECRRPSSRRSPGGEGVSAIRSTGPSAPY